MPKYNVRELIEYDDVKFLPKVLINHPGYRLVLLNLRDGQSVPEHANKNVVTVYAITGHITFYDGATPVNLRAGELVQIQGGTPHHLEAHEDSALLVIAAGNTAATEKTETEQVIDVRQIPGPQRHPLIFSAFDSLSIGESLIIVNDHDPIPLQRQIGSLRPGQAEWNYIIRGPEIFRIRVRRIAALKGSEFSPTIQPEGFLSIQGA